VIRGLDCCQAAVGSRRCDHSVCKGWLPAWDALSLTCPPEAIGAGLGHPRVGLIRSLSANWRDPSQSCHAGLSPQADADLTLRAGRPSLMVTEQLDAVIGVDTHRDTHTAALLRPTGAVVAATVIDTTGNGYQALLDFALAHAPGPRLLWAVEGTRSYGIGLVRFLHTHGQLVVEVDHPRRPARRRGKSDTLDAIGAAREVLARPHQAIPRQDGDREGLRVLLVARQGAITSRTAAINSLKALVLTAPDPIRDQLRSKPALAQAARCARMRRSSRRHPCDQARMLALRATARRVLALAAEVDELEDELAVLVRRRGPQLLAHRGVGVVVAAQLLVSWSHHGRVRSEAAFAMLAGVAPLPASSGTSSATASTAAATGRSTARCTWPCCPAWPTTPRPRSTSPAGWPKARPSPRSGAASSATSPAVSTGPCKPSPRGLDGHRSVRLVKGHRALCRFASTISRGLADHRTVAPSR
jgi:transposase